MPRSHRAQGQRVRVDGPSDETATSRYLMAIGRWYIQHGVRFIPRMELCDVPSNPRMIALLEAPGVKHSDLKLQLGLDKALLVSGTRSRRLPRGESPQQELGYGTFKRVIQLPEGTMLDTIEATLDDGLLFISWPRVLSNSAVSNTDSNPSDNMTVGQSPASGELATMANESETVNQPAITVEGSGQQPVI